MVFRIIGKDGLYWSNSIGWVDRGSATGFTAAEFMTLNLPDGGTWVWEKTMNS